jgi:DivIVA domain-containing protein
MAAILRSSDIAAARFTPTKFREGYSQSGVDDFLDVAARALAAAESRGQLSVAPELTGDDVVNVRFQPTKFRAGYDQDEVDTFLDRIVSALREHESAAG